MSHKPQNVIRTMRDVIQIANCHMMNREVVVHAVGERTLQNALRLRVQWIELGKLEQEARAHTPQATRTPSHAGPTRDEPGHSTRKKEQVPKLTSLGHKSTGPSHVSPRALCPWAGTTLLIQLRPRRHWVGLTHHLARPTSAQRQRGTTLFIPLGHPRHRQEGEPRSRISPIPPCHVVLP